MYLFALAFNKLKMKKLNFLYSLSFLFLTFKCTQPKKDLYNDTVSILKDSLLHKAQKNLSEPPITLTAAISVRSMGAPNEFFSEGDYWWPDPQNPSGSYVRKDGMTNPDNFTAHRKALMRLSEICGSLTSAFLITKDTAYSNAAKKHLNAWFVNEQTKMAPHFLYAQAIQGRHTGRGIGIIDAIHFIDVVQSVRQLEKHNKISSQELTEIKKWFASFLKWLTTHKYGLDEKVHPNNHGNWWNTQVALYAKFTNNDSILDFCRDNFKNKILPSQLSTKGSFPLELARTKPYSYSLFNLDGIVIGAQIMSDEDHDLWSFTTADGKSVAKALEYMAPFVADKSKWFLKPDVMYWEDFPVAQPAYILGAFRFKRTDYYDLWKLRKHFLEVEEVKRNVPLKFPLLWLAENK